MAGHSKWANIKHKKAAADKKKGKVFSRIAKEIMVAAKMGGGDADSNPRLRSALTSAKGVNMPNVNIDRAIKKGLGELGDVVFEELTYEGYGPAGVAVLVECLTENRNRSASEVRMVFDRSGGNLASSGAVAWMFHRKAHFVITGENADEDKLMEIVLDAGAEDIEVDGEVADIWGPPESFEDIMKALEEAGVATDEAAVERQPENTVELKEVKEGNSVLRMIDKLEDLDDVQAVTANFEIADEIADQIEAD
ncbi:MAG: YebC/PmpR family DNA-binding transcriptional regulator [Lentisphaerae bacterium]|nr:YebC/PmpR family DNA-binding transcriptional regulator [Lentisphaerota bacterium]MCP4103055.1 YebC/PmpR family DNA-binding transcriptional regulator [Lentisphaerota bacterium]